MKHTATTAKRDPAGLKLSYLILQGLASPFFVRLAQKLANEGARVHRVNFCGGDRWFSRTRHKNISHSRFNGPQETLSDYYRALIKQHAVTDIVLFGDCRPIHKIARAVAADLGLAVWVFEEGYIRPGFVTCEKEGSNDLSCLPRQAKAVTMRAQQTENEQPPHRALLPNPLPRRVRMDFAFHFWNLLLRPLYFRYKSHRPETMTAELAGWAARLAQKWRYRHTNAALVAHYETGTSDTGSNPFFFVPLQLNSDFQIREHSDYSNILDFICDVVASFARHAPKNTRLMFKSHPLDNGMADYRNYIAMAAIKHSIQDRVDYLEGGVLDLYLQHTAGLVLINSTVGYAALAAGKPLKVMGRALYNMAGLTNQKPLDKFWKKPEIPDKNLVADFLKVIRADSQIPGDFFTRQGIEMAATAAMRRLLQKQQRPEGVTQPETANEKSDDTKMQEIKAQ